MSRRLWTRPWGRSAFLLVGLLCASLTLVSVAGADEPVTTGTDASKAADASGGSGDAPPADAPSAPVAGEVGATDATPPAAGVSDDKTDEGKADEDKKTDDDAKKDGAAPPPPAPAPPTPPPSLTEVTYAFDNMILFICAVLVIFMQAGFALVEVGLNAAKNAVNILFKNMVDFALGVLLFFIVGYGLMYPGDNALIPGVLGFAQVGISLDNPEPAAAKLNPQVDFLFQVAFAATAATIVSGAVAGRIKFGAYLIYTAALTAFIYPVSGMWLWGGGWLKTFGFHDFAGSLVVHAVGGFAGLAGAILLGPRIGRFVKGKSNPMPGHNLAFAALGVFILWLGWYGFNPGSQLAFAGQGNTEVMLKVAVNTTLAAASGTVLAMMLSWILFKKPDLTMALNGALAGLVGITANCDLVSNLSSIAIGAVAGVLVVGGILALDKLRIDDPVGAFPVHGLCGIWGGIASAIFGGSGWVPQLVGIAVICSWSFVTMFAVFGILRLVGYLRVSKEEELAGLDISEHGMFAYPPNMVSDTYTGSPTTPTAGVPAGYSQPAPTPATDVA